MINTKEPSHQNWIFVGLACNIAASSVIPQYDSLVQFKADERSLLSRKCFVR